MRSPSLVSAHGFCPSLYISRIFSIQAGLSQLLSPAAEYLLNFYTLDISLQNKIERDTIFPLGDPVASHEYIKSESTWPIFWEKNAKTASQPDDWPLNTQTLGNILTTE